MLDSILYATAAWIIFGVVIAVVIFLDQRKHGEKGLIWPVVGLLLSLIGLLVYYMLVVRKRMVKAMEYPAKPQYEAPGYQFEKKGAEAEPAPKEERKVPQTEGAPRCTSCGAAISIHDPKCPRCGKQLR